MQEKQELHIEYILITELKDCEYNPRTWSAEDERQLTRSLTEYGVLDPLIINSTLERMNVTVGGNFRLHILRKLGIERVPTVRVHLTLEKEKELNIRLNKNQGQVDFNLLAEFDESFLADIGFNSEELDNIFEDVPQEEQFDLEKELEKLDIQGISVQKGDVYEIDGSRLMCGDSTIETDVLALIEALSDTMSISLMRSSSVSLRPGVRNFSMPVPGRRSSFLISNICAKSAVHISTR